MGQRRGWIAVLLMLGVLSGTAWGQGGDPAKPDDKKVKEALEAFTKKYSEGQQKKDEGTRVAALDLLSPVMADQRAMDAVAKVLGTASETEGTKSRAAMVLGESGNPKAIPVLVKAFGTNEKNPNLAPMLASRLGSINDKSSVKELDKIIRPRATRFDDADACGIACAGTLALGRLKFLESVETLMSLFDPVEKARPKNKGQGDPIEQAKEQQFELIEGDIISSLKTLTAQELEKPEDWKTWWSANKKTWKPQ